MRFSALTLGAYCALGVLSACAQSGVKQADDLDWMAAPSELPRGADVALLFGDPRQSGPFIVRLRAPAGYQVPAHRHPDLETITVLSGTLRVGEGKRFDPAAEQYVHAGGFFAAPAGMAHWIVANEDVVLQVTGTGPWRVDYVDPRNSPEAAREGALR